MPNLIHCRYYYNPLTSRRTDEGGKSKDKGTFQVQDFVIYLVKVTQKRIDFSSVNLVPALVQENILTGSKMLSNFEHSFMKTRGGCLECFRTHFNFVYQSNNIPQFALRNNHNPIQKRSKNSSLASKVDLLPS